MLARVKPVRHLPLLGSGAIRDVDRQAKPLYVVWELTLKCDLACIHCGSRAGRTRPAELDTGEALSVVDQLAAMGTREITLIGGEAYLRDDWDVIARAIVRHGMTCGVVTGGRGLDRTLAGRMRDAGVDGVSVSIDGLEATHDALRGVRGSFRSAVAALEHLEAVGVRRAINSQINRASVRELEPLVDLVAPRSPYGWQLSMTVPMGRAADHHEQLLLQPFQMIETFAMLARLEAKTRALDIMLFAGNNVGYFGPYEERLRRETPRESCGAGRTTMGIEANGDVKGCPSLPSDAYVGGNVRTQRLEDIWLTSDALRFTRARTTGELTGFCATCYYAESCLGGCSWTSHVFFGRRGDNPYCHHRALERLAAGKRERLVMREKAEGVPFDHGSFDVVLEDYGAEELARAHAIAESGEGFVEEGVVLPSPRPAIRR